MGGGKAYHGSIGFLLIINCLNKNSGPFGFGEQGIPELQAMEEALLEQREKLQKVCFPFPFSFNLSLLFLVVFVWREVCMNLSLLFLVVFWGRAGGAEERGLYD